MPAFFLLALSLVLALVLLEGRWGASAAPADRLNNLKSYGLHFAVQLTLLPAVALAIPAEVALFDLSAWPLLWGAVVFALAMDLGEYAFHRAQHTFPWLWRMHALHHSDPNMNVTTTVRHFWGDQLLKAVTIWPLCELVLRPTPAILLCYSLLSLVHFFAHANLRIGFGRWSWLLNHPAYHRRHHSADPRHFGSNYAGLFPIFDVIFGTYKRPDGFPETGLDTRPRTLLQIATWPLRTR
jgi:sterol desaturase/sphingolipid hydroxylase (fatty acid hydroxylase superfamily)